MVPEEQEYCLRVLWQIKPDWTKAQVTQLLGSPSRDMGLKTNWWVILGNKKDRVGVYFTTSGLASEVVLDGGPGRFYYHRPVTDHQE